MVPHAIWWTIWKKRNSQYWEGLARLLIHIRFLPGPVSLLSLMAPWGVSPESIVNLLDILGEFAIGS